MHINLGPDLKDLHKFIESGYEVKVLCINKKIATINLKVSDIKNNIVNFLDYKASIEQIKKPYKFLRKTMLINDKMIDQTILNWYFDSLMMY